MTHDHHDDLAEMSDWEEQDLLTLDEAGGRLAAEVETARAELARLAAAGDDDAAARVEARLELLVAALERVRPGGTG